MRLSRRFALPAAAVTVVGALTGAGSIGTASAAAPEAAGGGYGGYSDGTAFYVNALNTSQADVAKVYTANSAAGAAVGQKLHTKDALDNPLLVGKKASGHNAYGHGSALNGSFGQVDGSDPQLAQSAANVVSPPQDKADGNPVPIPDNPLLTASLLPSHAEANTKSADSLCVGPPISSGEGHIADARVLHPGSAADSLPGPLADLIPAGSDFSLVNAPGEIDSKSAMGLGDSAKGASGNALIAQTVQSIAPIHLFEGASLPSGTSGGGGGSGLPIPTPTGVPTSVPTDVPTSLSSGSGAAAAPNAGSSQSPSLTPSPSDSESTSPSPSPTGSGSSSGAIEIDVLTDIALEATAGGEPGSAHLRYGFLDKDTGKPVSGDTTVVHVKYPGGTQDITSQQILGGDGLTLHLGLADITIGAPPHAIGDSSAKPAEAADGTSASGAVDFLQISAPGSPGDLGATGGGQLAPVVGGINSVLGQLPDQLTGGIDQIRQQLEDQVPNLLDLRLGHMESSASVPEGGVVCPAANNGGGHEQPPPPAPKPQHQALAFTGLGAAAPLGALGLVLAGLGAVALRRRARHMQ